MQAGNSMRNPIWPSSTSPHKPDSVLRPWACAHDVYVPDAAVEGKQSAAEAVQAANGMESMRAVISTSLTARRWQSKTVSKALPALAPFVPRMLRDDLLTAQPHCLSGALRSQSSELYSQRSSIDGDSEYCHCMVCHMWRSCVQHTCQYATQVVAGIAVIC